MGIKYLTKPFEGFTYRFKVQIKANTNYYVGMDIYSDSESYEELGKFLSTKDKIAEFKITHRASKEEDEMESEFIDSVLNAL